MEENKVNNPSDCGTKEGHSEKGEQTTQEVKEKLMSLFDTEENFLFITDRGHQAIMNGDIKKLCAAIVFVMIESDFIKSIIENSLKTYQKLSAVFDVEKIKRILDPEVTMRVESNNWISVKECLPMYKRHYMVCTKDFIIYDAKFDPEKKTWTSFNDSFVVENVAWWIPIPQKPIEED